MKVVENILRLFRIRFLQKGEADSMIDVDVRLNQMDTKLKEVKCSRCGRMMVFQIFYGPHEHFLGW